MRGTTTRRGSTWTARWDEPTAKRRRQRSRGGFATKRAAQAFLTDQRRRLDDGTYAAPHRATVGEFFTDEWMPAAEGTLRPLSVTQYRSVIRRYVVPGIGHVRLQALAGGHLNALHADLERAGLSVSTRRLVHAVIHRGLRDGVRWGRVARSAADQADPPRAARSRAHAWTAGELRRFLDHVADDRLHALWRLAATTGMRRGELAGTTWRALDLDGARLEISQQLVPTRGGPTLGPPKSTRSRRTVALDPETVDALRRHRDAQLLERDFGGPAYVDRDFVFCDEIGGPIYPNRLTDWFRRHRQAAGIPTGSLHTLRHSVITLMLTGGIPVHVVAARVGDTPTTVLSSYAHLLPQSDELAAERVAAVLASPS